MSHKSGEILIGRNSVSIAEQFSKVPGADDGVPSAHQ